MHDIFLRQHQVFKELEPHTTGNEVVSFFLYPGVHVQVNLFTRCNEIHAVLAHVDD